MMCAFWLITAVPAEAACWKSYSCQNPSLLALDKEKWAAEQKTCTPGCLYVQ